MVDNYESSNAVHSLPDGLSPMDYVELTVPNKLSLFRFTMSGGITPGM